MSVSFVGFSWTAQIPCGMISNLQSTSRELSVGRGLEKRAEWGEGHLFWSVYRLGLDLPVFSTVSPLISASRLLVQRPLFYPSQIQTFSFVLRLGLRPQDLYTPPSVLLFLAPPLHFPLPELPDASTPDLGFSEVNCH